MQITQSAALIFHTYPARFVLNRSVNPLHPLRPTPHGVTAVASSSSSSSLSTPPHQHEDASSQPRRGKPHDQRRTSPFARNSKPPRKPHPATTRTKLVCSDTASQSCQLQPSDPVLQAKHRHTQRRKYQISFLPFRCRRCLLVSVHSTDSNFPSSVDRQSLLCVRHKPPVCCATLRFPSLLLPLRLRGLIYLLSFLLPSLLLMRRDRAGGARISGSLALGTRTNCSCWRYEARTPRGS